MDNNTHIPFFSVIVPTYNRAAFIENTINTIFNQEFKDFEVILIDDGSTDSTSEVVKKLDATKVVYLKTINQERGAARNEGVKLAKGKYVTFLDSDDVMYPNHLRTAYNYLMQHENISALHVQYELLNADTQHKTALKQLNDNSDDLLIQENFMSCRGVFLEKTVAQNNLFYGDRKLAGLEDWELWIRIACKYKFHFINEVSSALVLHNNRSVVNFSKDNLISKFQLFEDLVWNQNKLTEVRFPKSKGAFLSNCNSYIALHLALTKQHRFDTVVYLCKSFFNHPRSIFKRRTLAVLKHLM